MGYSEPVVVGDEGAQVSLQTPGEGDSDLAWLPPPVMIHSRDLRGGHVIPDNGFLSTIMRRSAVSEHRDKGHPQRPPGASDRQLQAGSLPPS